MISRKLSCRAVRDLLPLHAGGDLPAPRGHAVDEHLSGCLACFREYREFLDLRGRLGVLAEEPLPAGALDGFTEEVMARIAIGEAGPAAELPARPGRLLSLPRLAAAAALLVGLFAGWQQFSATDGPPTAAPGTLVRLDGPFTAVDLVSPGATPPRPSTAPQGLSGIERALIDFGGLPAARQVLREGGGQGLLPEPGRRLRPRDEFDGR